ncbi:MAG: hypothetical protein ACOVNV_10755 [Pirellulaceae bacterium]
MADHERSKLLPRQIWYRNHMLGWSSKCFQTTLAPTDPLRSSHFWIAVDNGHTLPILALRRSG